MNHGMTLASVHSTDEVARTVRTPTPIGDYLPPHVSRQKMTVFDIQPVFSTQTPEIWMLSDGEPRPKIRAAQGWRGNRKNLHRGDSAI
jgi:hypothetical protein